MGHRDGVSLFGRNGTFGDLDMLPMSASWWAAGAGSPRYDLGQVGGRSFPLSHSISSRISPDAPLHAIIRQEQDNRAEENCRHRLW
jgi:hypothetical protein